MWYLPFRVEVTSLRMLISNTIHLPANFIFSLYLNKIL